MNKPRPAATLLIVDDTPDNVRVLFDFLLGRNYQVLVCENGQAALDTLEIEEPDLILLDVMMPGLDGFETCRRLKAHPAGRDVPVFFMTALGDPYDRVRGLEAGAIDYLTKPVYPQEVLARIQAHLEIRQLQKSLQEQNDRLDAARQRSLTAEHALRNSLDAALLVVRRPDCKVLFCTEQAQALISRHGGLPALDAWLAGTAETVRGHGEARIGITRKLNPATPDTLLVTLREEPLPRSPQDLAGLGLTPRETEILFWVAQGKTSPEIAVILGMQVCTVKKHVENFLPKLGAPTRFAAALQAQKILDAG
jgi:DNA-binding response OmpR family regulator/DNA-binding CsgD family transcriptional regulator